VKNGGLDGT